MNISVDGFSISHLEGTGLYVYGYELIDKILNIYPQSQYHLIWNADNKVKPWNKYKNLNYANLNINRYRNDYQLLEQYIKRNNIHIYHSLHNGFSVPLNKINRCKYIMTVHDIIPVSNPQLSDDKYKEKFKKTFKRSMENADKIITVSTYLKNELLKYYNISKNKVEVIYPGCSSRFRPMDKLKTRNILKDKYNIKSPYILYAGSIHKRKKLPLLIESFKNIKAQYPRLKLVIVGKIDGKRTNYYKELITIAERLGVIDDIIFTNIVKYEDMPFIYNGAKCFINLSEYEGFPFTVVEAMACNIPVVTLKEPYMKEIIGKKGLYLEEASVQELQTLILKAIYNKEEKIINKDEIEETIKRFSWEESVKKLINIYESIA